MLAPLAEARVIAHAAIIRLGAGSAAPLINFATDVVDHLPTDGGSAVAVSANA